MCCDLYAISIIACGEVIVKAGWELAEAWFLSFIAVTRLVYSRDLVIALALCLHAELITPCMHALTAAAS
jgi:hypothetical protein